MNLGDTLRALVEEHFPEHISRTVTYSAKEAELQVKFDANKKGLPDAERTGWLIAEALKQMQANNYTRFSRIWSSIEANIKMTVTISARSNGNVIPYNTSR